MKFHSQNASFTLFYSSNNSFIALKGKVIHQMFNLKADSYIINKYLPI